MAPIDSAFDIDAGSLHRFMSWQGGDVGDGWEVELRRVPGTRTPGSVVVGECDDEDGPGGVDPPAWSLRVYTLGRFAVVRNGCELRFNGKSPRKPLELLMALLALGARDIHVDTLMRAVWPDDASADARNLFDNTLYRLRHLLGGPGMLPLSNSKLSLNPQRCWVDAWAFDRLADAAPPAAPWHALGLYRGHFLESEPQRPWAAACRERLRRQVHRLLLTTGAQLEASARWREAAEVYERGLELDPLAEDIYQRLLACHHRRGQHAQAARVYQRCHSFLAAELGVAPSPATQAAAKGCEDVASILLALPPNPEADL